MEVHERLPPAVERLLHETELLVGARDQREDHVAAVEDVEGLLPADLLHDPRVGRVRALEERLLRDDRRRVDEPRDDADVAPRPRRVVEDVVELRLARDEVVEAGAPGLAEVLDDAVDQLRVADLVLDLRGEGELPLQRRRTEDPVALREDAHELRVPVHLDELDQPSPVLVRHPVVRLHLPAGLDVVEELLRARVHVLGLPTERSLASSVVATRREELTREAARLFAERGFHGTSMDALAQALGVQKGSLYSLTGSKQELLFATMREGAVAFHAALDDVPDDASAVERIRLALRGHLRVVSEQLAWRPCSSANGVTSRASTVTSFMAERRRYEERWRALFRDGVETGGLRTDLDAAAATLLVLSAANWAYTWLEPGRDTEELADRFTAILVDGIRGYATPA